MVAGTGKTDSRTTTGRKLLSSLLILLCSGVFLAFSVAPNFINSRKVNLAYSKYVQNPSEQNRRVYEETVTHVNRPFWVAQYVSAGLGLLSLSGRFWVWKRHDGIGSEPSSRAGGS